MTDTEPNSTPDEAAELESMKFPTRPRFTLDDLREIRIAGGDGESTVAAYCFDHNGEPAEKVVALDDLTHAEREAALAFILAHGQAAAIRRKKPKKTRRSPRLYSTEAVEFDPVDLDELKPPSLPEIDTAPLDALTAGETAGKQDTDGTEAPRTHDSGKDG